MSNLETSSPNLSPHDFFVEVMGLGLSDWLLQPGVAKRLEETAWVNSIKGLFRPLEEKDRGLIVEKVKTHVEARIKPEEGAEVLCANLRFVVASLRAAQRPPSGDNNKPDGGRQRGARTQAATGNTRTAANEASSSGRKGPRKRYTPEEKADTLADLESGKTPEAVAEARDIPVNTVISWNTARKRAAAEAAAGKGNQGGTSSSDNEGGESDPASSGSSAGPTTDDSGTAKNS